MPPQEQNIPPTDQIVPQPATESSVNKESLEKNPEDEVTMESAKNVGELIDFWLKKSQATESDDERTQLCYCIIKMKMALSLSKLDADEVKIKDYDPGTGTLGVYFPDADEVAVTPEGINLPPKYFAELLVHESIHQGKANKGRRIFDEGFTELLTKRIVPGALTGDYVKEKQRAAKVFDKGEMSEALHDYDFDHPLVLVAYYLGVEWKDRWDAAIKQNYLQAKAKEKFDENAYLESILKSNEDVVKDFKKGVPEMYHQLIAENFSFDRFSSDVLRHLVKGH